MYWRDPIMTTANTSSRLGASLGPGAAGAGSASTGSAGSAGSAGSGANSITGASDSEEDLGGNESGEGLEGASLMREGRGAAPALEGGEKETEEEEEDEGWW